MGRRRGCVQISGRRRGGRRRGRRGGASKRTSASCHLRMGSLLAPSLPDDAD